MVLSASSLVVYFLQMLRLRNLRVAAIFLVGTSDLKWKLRPRLKREYDPDPEGRPILEGGTLKMEFLLG